MGISRFSTSVLDWELYVHTPTSDGADVHGLLEQIDSMFQSLSQPPQQHVIIEAHPDVLQHMRELGWYSKSGVTILEGKWQYFVDSGKLSELGSFDAIYTDTFSEDYQGQRSYIGIVHLSYALRRASRIL